jgi:peptidase inhibitor family I36
MFCLGKMSVASGLILGFAFATAAAAQPSRDPRDGACFYENPNYSGRSFCVRAGEGLQAVPRGMNDRVTSIRTFGPTEVTVYRDVSFRGPALRFDGDVPDLRQTSWNDMISSVQVGIDRFGYRGGYGERGGYSGRGYYDRSARGAAEMVRRAYRDVLGREPDTEEMQYYRDRIVDNGWSEARIRQDLRRGTEHRTRTRDETFGYGMTRQRAENVVRNAYRSVLSREPDAASEGYVEHVLRDGWSQTDVERDLRGSAEYRDRVR